MATKSIFKAIIIRDNKRCRSLLSALEKSSSRPQKKINSRKCETVTDPATIREFFNKATPVNI